MKEKLAQAGEGQAVGCSMPDKALAVRMYLQYATISKTHQAPHDLAASG